MAAGAGGVAAVWQQRATEFNRQFERKEEQWLSGKVVVVRFTEPSKAYQALSVLKQCDADGRIALGSEAVVERTLTGELRIAEGVGSSSLSGSSASCASLVWFMTRPRERARAEQ